MEGPNAQNQTKVIMDILMVASGLIKVEVSKRLLCFGENNVNTFQDVEMELQSKFGCYVPFFIGIHYTAHQTNIAVQKLSHLPTVTQLKDLL